MQSAQLPTFHAISIFLQIRLDDSNYHIFPPYFTQMKWKIEGSSAHKHERTLQFFTFFPAIYSTYNGSAQKNRAGFSHVRVCGLGQTNFPPVIYAYIQSRLRCVAQDRRGGSNQPWAYLAYGEYKTRLKSAQMAWHGYDAICAHNLFAVYHIDKLPADNRTSFYDGKMCECAQIFHVKMWCCGWIFIWKMWTMFTLILIYLSICAWK